MTAAAAVNIAASTNAISCDSEIRDPDDWVFGE